MTPRSCLRWKPMGRIFQTVGLRWVPTGKIFTSSTTKVDSEPPNGSNLDITNHNECEQTLDVSASTLNLSAVGLRWVPTGKIFTSSTTKVDSEPPNGSNLDITNHNECEQTLDVSASTLNLSA
nr:hypothetical protein [Tanacetum cinerariifolium]